MSINELVLRHIEWINATARRYYRNPQDAEDLAAETVYKCLSAGKDFDTSKAFKPWALTIMANTYITQYNRRRCVLFTSMEGVDSCSQSNAADQSAVLNRIFTIIRKCARRSDCIECVMLYAKGFSYEEIAAMVDIPVGTVKSRIAAGRKMLRAALEE